MERGDRGRVRGAQPAARSGLKSFVKTSGGKGLHVVLPIEPPPAGTRRRNSPSAVAEGDGQAQPDRYVAKMAKKARRGRIFVDYLRNGRGATAVAPYSTRALPLAPVSTPLAWDELSEGARRSFPDRQPSPAARRAQAGSVGRIFHPAAKAAGGRAADMMTRARHTRSGIDGRGWTSAPVLPVPLSRPPASRRRPAPGWGRASRGRGRGVRGWGGSASNTDYIIVGAGSAGCVLANRLSADAPVRVLLLEAGGMDNWIWFHIPVGYLFAIGNPRSDWMFKTEPEPGLNGRSLNYPRGKVIGGSSAINAMIYMRGQAADYDHWRQLGLTGWGWDDVLPFFKRHEDHVLGPSEAHAVGGELRIEAPRVRWDILDAFRDAGERGRYQAHSRFQHRRQRGQLRLPRQPEARPALVGGARLPQAGARSRPICGSKPNAWPRGSYSRASARWGCAGGRRARRGRRDAAARWSSPPARSARSSSSSSPGSAPPASSSVWASGRARQAGRGREPAGSSAASADLRGRGRARRSTRSIARCLAARAWASTTHCFGAARSPWRPRSSGMFTRSDPSRERANIQFHVQPLSLDKFGDPAARVPRHHGERLQSAADEPRHRAVALHGPADKPMIKPNYLSTDEDRRVAADSIRVARRIVAQPALASYRPAEYLPGPLGRRRRRVIDQGRRRYRHHDLPSRRHGQDGSRDDPMAVVDERLRVIGHRAPARGRRLHHADDHVGQHQCPDHDDRGEGRCDDPILFTARTEWRVIEQESSGMSPGYYLGYVAILAAVPELAPISSVGDGRGAYQPLVPPSRAVVAYAATLAAVASGRCSGDRHCSLRASANTL